MVGGIILQLIGALALLCGACELVLRALRLRRRRAWTRRRLRDLDTGAPEGAPCPSPRLEPEVERLREKGAL